MNNMKRMFRVGGKRDGDLDDDDDNNSGGGGDDDQMLDTSGAWGGKMRRRGSGVQQRRNSGNGLQQPPSLPPRQIGQQQHSDNNNAKNKNDVDDHDDDDDDDDDDDNLGATSVTTPSGTSQQDSQSRHQVRSRLAMMTGNDGDASEVQSVRQINASRPDYRNYDPSGSQANNSGSGGGGGSGKGNGGGGGGNNDDDHDGRGGGGILNNNNDGKRIQTKNIESSAGTHRLNRILHRTGMSLDGEPLDEDDLIMEAVGMPAHHHPYNNNNNNSSGANGGGGGGLFHGDGTNKFGGTRIVKVSDPTDLEEVGNVCSRYVIPPLKVDPASIGGNMLDGYPESMIQETLLTAACSNFESTGGQDTIPMSMLQFPAEYIKHKRTLGLFSVSSNKSRAGKRRYVLVARSTNKPLLGRPKDLHGTNPFNPLARLQQEKLLQQQEQLLSSNSNNNNNNNNNNRKSVAKYKGGDEYGDESERADYDAMFAAEPDDNGMMMDDDGVSSSKGGGGTSNHDSLSDLGPGGGGSTPDGTTILSTSTATPDGNKIGSSPTNNNTSDVVGGGDDMTAAKLPVGRVNFDVVEDQEEISSFPVLICMTLHQDGTAPDVRKLIALDQLTTVQDLHSTVVQLAFSNGDTVRLDFGGNVNDKDKIVERSCLDKERFIWSLLQIHAILCTAVVERNSMETNNVVVTKDRMYLPPLNVRNLDRAELQYVATVNGFLRKSIILCALLKRQRNLVDSNAKKKSSSKQKQRIDDDINIREQEEKESKGDDDKLDMESMEEMAYDLMMGNFATRVTLFHSEEERKDAEEILNSTEWTSMLTNKDDQSAAVNVAQLLGSMLQGKMRDLEAETCRRLIAWEDEKNLSSKGKGGLHDESDDRDTVDALALASLFKTLEALDTELLLMENWLQDRAAAIKPLTDDCADIEEENRQLEQQWKSYDMLGAEMRRLLQGLEINEFTEKTLSNPASALVYTSDGAVNIEESEYGINKIYEAGKALLDAIEYPKRSGGLHLKSVSERAKGLAVISMGFCSSLAQIIVTVMEQFKSDVVAGSDHGKVSKSDTHSMIAKKIRDTQRKFQSALLGYIKLIEILAALNPEMLPALRDAYAEMVAEGILMKKRMKGYFQALPAKNIAHLNKAGKDLKDYVPFVDPPMKEDVVNAPDIRAALGELLPVIAREAYFTSALFGSNKKEQDGREKKRNFENAKNAVDKASVHFRYYINRTCGIIDLDNNRNVDLSKVDPMLCLVATIYLNEAMDNYIDREKKGGDHSLSLAYVRASILDLRKKADKQWVAWVEKQIEWIKIHDGVPLSGKRAGIFPSFARFPKYLDHLILCCSEGRDEDYTPDLAGIKVINYYLQKIAVNLLESLKECANRESTDKTYASNVMKMENTYFFTQSIKHRGEVMSKLFAKQVMKANAICKESTDAYLGWMIKREFTALHELFSRVSKARKEFGDREVIKHVPKDQFVKILQKEASRDILKEKIGAMFTRMEKHLSEEGGLLIVAWKALVKVLYEWFGRWEKLCTSIYQHKIDPSAVDVVRIAKAAGIGVQKPRPQANINTTGGPDPTNNNNEFGFTSILALGNNNNANSTISGAPATATSSG